MAFMQEFELEAHQLGIPVKTRHNEVAPNQFECAPVYEEVNLAVDHNQLLMHLMEKVARRHDFTVLLHEKPFQRDERSGKHNNWSLATNTRENLLSPGKTAEIQPAVPGIPGEYPQSRCMNMLTCSGQSLHRREMTTALAEMRHRHAIISVFIGEQLTQSSRHDRKEREESKAETRH